MIPGGRLIGFTAGGRYLLVTSGESVSYLLDPRTFARVHTFRLGGKWRYRRSRTRPRSARTTAACSSSTCAAARCRPMGRRATGRVIAVGFSRDGKVLATTSDDGSVGIWDVATREPARDVHRPCRGGGRAVFSPDGATLYTGAGDGSEIAWDVRGMRRLGRPFRFAPVAQGGEGAHAPAQGAAGASRPVPDSSFFVTSPGPNRVTMWRARDLRRSSASFAGR